jgi:hypothetical protein
VPQRGTPPLIGLNRSLFRRSTHLSLPSLIGMMFADKQPGVGTGDSTAADTVLNTAISRLLRKVGHPSGGAGKSNARWEIGTRSAGTTTSGADSVAGVVLLNIYFSEFNSRLLVGWRGSRAA